MPDYSSYLTTHGLPEVLEAVHRAQSRMDADGRPAQAQLIRRAYVKLISELEKIATETAAYGEKTIKENEVVSRVRPDTGGGGGPRLEDYVGVSRPLTAVPGSVGLNDEEPLYDNVPWWWTNEEGYSGHVGRELVGVFTPGNAAPSGAEFRVHPLFRPLAKGPKGIIDEPIPAREFVKDGVADAEAKWHARVRAAKRHFDGEVERVMLMSRRPTVRPIP